MSYPCPLMVNTDIARRTDQARLIDSLQEPGVYPHPVSAIEVKETHISWVILTGTYAYKIKKAVNLGFLDFGTLEQRRYFCEEELRLNAAWAPQLYLGIVPIGGNEEHPSFESGGKIIEYAVKMHQFPQEAQLDRQLENGLLRDSDLYSLAETIAGNHAEARVIAYENDGESVGKVSAPILDNFTPVERAIDMELLTRVHRWTETKLKALKPLLIQRRKDGFVRECHGDLHLSNLVRLQTGIFAFDCVEFSADLRNIDVLSDIAFLVMDLVARARQDLAFAFLNRYLERSGDYGGMSVFALYFVYHSMIRAKVAAIRSTERDNEREREKDIEAVKHYLAVAVRWIKQRGPRLVAMHGLSGSGKTWLSSQLQTRLPAIRLRSDIERKRLFGLDESTGSGSKPGSGIYTAEAGEAVYSHLFEAAGRLLDDGFNVIVDAAFLKRPERRAILELGKAHDVPAVFLSTEASVGELERRLRRRGQEDRDVSEADIEVLRLQLETADPMNDAERSRCISVSTDQAVDADEVVKVLGSFK